MNIGLRLIHEKMYITTKIEYQFHNLLSCINMVAAFIRQNMINFLNPIYLNTLDHICELRYNMTIIKNGGKQMEAANGPNGTVAVKRVVSVMGRNLAQEIIIMKYPGNAMRKGILLSLR